MKNELSVLENKETITSLELLEQINFFRKEEKKPETNHADLLVIIETEFADINRKRIEGGVRPETLDLIKLELTKENINTAEYKHPQNGQIYPMYILPISKAKQALLKESKFVRKAVIAKLEQLETQLKDNNKLPATYKDALLELVSKVEQIELLESENKIQEQIIEEFKPMKEYLDKILKDSESTLTITQIAADYGLSARALNALLHEQGLIRKVNGQWLLYSEHLNKGYTKSETIEVSRKNGSMKTIINTKWLQKGRLKIHEILTNLGIKANEDKEAS